MPKLAILLLGHCAAFLRPQAALRPQHAPRPQLVRDAANIQYGDTGGAALVLDDLSVSRGPVELVSGASWTCMPGERWGIVGPNGAGKSTLLGAILGVHESTTGKVAVKAGIDVGYLEQTGVGGSETTVREEVMSRMGALAAAQRALDEATAKVEGGDYSEEALEALGDAQAEFEERGGYSSEETVSKVLGGLGFDTKNDLDRPCSDFSGGWQMRIALARLLLSGPELLLLDEPTNHLDSAARSWLAQYLSTYEGTLVLVSHDTAMLKRACDSIAEVVGDAPSADRPAGNGRRLETYFRRADILQTGRGGAAAATWLFRGDEPPRPRRGHSVETGARLRYKSCSFDKWRQQRAERAFQWVSTYERPSRNPSS